MTSTLLAFESVTCLRGDRLLFEALDFRLTAGAAAIVTGPNGIGKSSLLRIAATLLPPAAGSVIREGGIAWLGEQSALDSHMPLADALRYWAKLDGAEDSAVAAALEAVDLSMIAEVPVRMLSTGQRRRAGLARVIASPAMIWILDEPGNGLDIAALDRLAQAIAQKRASGGIVIAATHQPILIPDALTIALEGRQ